jgi:hypothetical protein
MHFAPQNIEIVERFCFAPLYFINILYNHIHIWYDHYMDNYFQISLAMHTNRAMMLLDRDTHIQELI